HAPGRVMFEVARETTVVASGQLLVEQAGAERESQAPDPECESQAPAAPVRAAPPQGGGECESQAPAAPVRAAPPQGGGECESQAPAAPVRAAPPQGGAECE